MKTPTKIIRIRTVTPNAPVPNTGQGLRYYVTAESDAAIHLDNCAPDSRFRARFTLSKMPNGRLENSAGQQFEIVPSA
jgi:hypothetical protein